ncbi:hypothetical protein H4I95_02094 [Botrytis cinerea]
MDPVSIFGLTGSVLTAGKVVMNLIASLNTLKSKYESAGLMAILLIGQLTTIKTALNEVSNWIATSLHGFDKHDQLIINLESSLESCHVFILMLDNRIIQLDRTGIDRKLKRKPNYTGTKFKNLPWQPVKQRSSPDIVDNPFLDPHEGPTNLPSAHSLYEKSSDKSSSHRNNDPCRSSYQHLEILHYILLSGYSNSGKRTLTDSTEFLSQDMTKDENWIYGKAIQLYTLRCIMHDVWETKKFNVSSHWAERYGLYNIGDFRDGRLDPHNIWSYKGWSYDQTPETIDQLATTSWNGQGFRKTFDAWSSKISRMKAVEIYFRSIDRIWYYSYIPTKEDLLLLFSRARNMDIV